ncbi:hypothetical protein DUI87_15374 [Hirundo rustica rustica]|uniref:Uncharacterized protein n=1 Tax=Hirundo rustica rustica TaxID=333673 RepID=A0A3M0K3W9_HIRRU|nr:hypothetical protein DUI87_15374 [Hirundo rustica rustica]
MVNTTAHEDLLKLLAHTRMKTRAAMSDLAIVVIPSDFSVSYHFLALLQGETLTFLWQPDVSPTLTCEAASANAEALAELFRP